LNDLGCQAPKHIVAGRAPSRPSAFTGLCIRLKLSPPTDVGGTRSVAKHSLLNMAHPDNTAGEPIQATCRVVLALRAQVLLRTHVPSTPRAHGTACAQLLVCYCAAGRSRIVCGHDGQHLRARRPTTMRRPMTIPGVIDIFSARRAQNSQACAGSTRWRGTRARPRARSHFRSLHSSPLCRSDAPHRAGGEPSRRHPVSVPPLAGSDRPEQLLRSVRRTGEPPNSNSRFALLPD